MLGSPHVSRLSILLLALFLDSARSQINQTISAIDPRITYVGEWTEQDNGAHMFTSVAGNFSLDFQGTAVYWFSRRIHNGAIASVTLDDEDAVVIDLSEGTTSSQVDGEAAVEVLFQKVDLDASDNHHLIVRWNGPGGAGAGSFLENYRVIYTIDSDTTSSGSTSTSSGSASGPGTSNGHIGAIVGGVVGGVVGVLIIALALLWFKKRRGRRSDIQNTVTVTPFVAPQSPPNNSSTPSMKQPLTSGQLGSSQLSTSTPATPETTTATSSPETRANANVRETANDPPPLYSR